MVKTPLPVGVEDFGDLRRNNYYFVDKTMFIRDLLDKKGEVHLITRPRRFGRTLNMSMLRYFFERGKTDNSELFRELKIMEAGEKYLSHMGKYPVISLSLQSMKQNSYELSFEMLKKAVQEEFVRHWEDVNAGGRLIDAERDRYLRICDLTGSEGDYLYSLKFLSECLHISFGRKAVILIDALDVPLENAYFSGFYGRMESLLRAVLEPALKTNENLEFAVMTGCLRISKESVFFGLNNLNVVPVTSDSFARYFGFVPGEVEQILIDYGLEDNLETVKQWYGGYRFGKTEVYNPWSVINFVNSHYCDKNASAKPFWSDTGPDRIIRNLLEHGNISVKLEIETLIAGGTITEPVYEEITYDDIEADRDNLWNFLFFTGYLKKISEWQEGETIYMEMAIPNSEVRCAYKNTVLRWFEETTEKKDFSPLYESILDGDTEKMADILSENLMETIIFYDSQESSYYSFLIGILKNIGNCTVQFNRESGNGMPDILLKYPGGCGRAVIIEIRVSQTYQGLDEKCDEALRQIEEQKYEEALRQEGYQDILKYGVAFYRKECMVKMQK